MVIGMRYGVKQGSMDVEEKRESTGAKYSRI